MGDARARARTNPRLYVKHVRARGRLSETMATRADIRAKTNLRVARGMKYPASAGMPGDF